MLGHHLYLRPGELFRLAWQHFMATKPPNPSKLSVVLHPREGGLSSKVGLFDEVTIVDWKWLVAAIEHLRPRASKQQALEILPVTRAQFYKVWSQACVRLKLDKLLQKAPHVYILRHTGATADGLNERRSIPAIKERGRWAIDASVRRYKKGGRALEVLARCSMAIREHSARCEKCLPQVFVGFVAHLVSANSMMPSVVPFGLELFAGTRRFAKAASQFNIMVIAFDRSFGTGPHL
jgi:integrase